MGSMVTGLLSFFGAGACGPGNENYHSFLGLLPWYHYVNLNSQCQFDASHTFVVLGGDSTLFLIVLAIIDDLLRVAGLLAVIFIIYSGVKFILSQGSPDEAAKARTAAINALVGLAITMVAISFVAFLGNKIGGFGHGGTSSNPKNPIDLYWLPNPGDVENGGILKTVLSIVFSVIGALSFLTIVIAGFKYILSQGDPQNVSRAKNTIIYALVGLVIALVAQSVVSLTVGRS